MGAKGAAERMINSLSESGMISDLPDTLEYGQGLNKITALLEKKDFDNARKDILNTCINQQNNFFTQFNENQEKLYNGKEDLIEKMEKEIITLLKFKN